MQLLLVIFALPFRCIKLCHRGKNAKLIYNFYGEIMVYSVASYDENPGLIPWLNCYCFAKSGAYFIFRYSPQLRQSQLFINILDIRVRDQHLKFYKLIIPVPAGRLWWVANHNLNNGGCLIKSSVILLVCIVIFWLPCFAVHADTFQRPCAWCSHSMHIVGQI